MSEPTDGYEPVSGIEPAAESVPTLDAGVAATPAPDVPRRAITTVAAIAACAALVAGIGGFLIGRTSVRSAQSNASITAAANDSGGATAASTPNVSGETNASPVTVGAPVPMAGDAKMATAAGGPGQFSPNAYAEQAQELIAERTTSTGITIRAHRQNYGTEMFTPYQGQYGGWTPAGWCFPTGQLRISIATSSALNISGAPWYTDPKGGVAVSTFAAGYVEDSPLFGATVQVGADVTSVTFTTASGLTDTTTPTKGIALVAVKGPIEDSFTVTLTKSDGTKADLSSATLTAPYSSTEYHDSCDPPPPVLPPAGAQPADPAAAETAVRESWRLAHTFAATDPAAQTGYIDDATGVEAAWKAIGEGPYADAAKTATATIKDFVFTSPTEAWFRYDIVTSIINFTDRYGMAHLGDDGVWRITRQTVCQDLSLAPGNGCTPSVETLLPPSAANDPRYSQGGVTGIDDGTGVPMPGGTPVSVGAPQK